MSKGGARYPFLPCADYTPSRSQHADKEVSVGLPEPLLHKLVRSGQATRPSSAPESSRGHS